MMRTDIARICASAVLMAAVGASSFSGAERTSRHGRAAKPIRALLVLGGCCHAYDQQKDVLDKGISERANVTVTVAYDTDKGTTHLNPVYDNPEWAKDFDVVIHDECTSDMKDLASIDRILKPHRGGLPAVILHCGEHSYRSEGWPKTTPWFELTGAASTAHGPQVPIALTFVDKQSRITSGMADWTTINEELYNNSDGKLLDTARALVRGKQSYRDSSGQEKVSDVVSVWTNTYAGKARVFATTIGHNTETVSDPRYLDLVTRGLLWSVKRLDKDGKPASGYGPK